MNAIISIGFAVLLIVQFLGLNRVHCARKEATPDDYQKDVAKGLEVAQKLIDRIKKDFCKLVNEKVSVSLKKQATWDSHTKYLKRQAQSKNLYMNTTYHLDVMLNGVRSWVDDNRREIKKVHKRTMKGLDLAVKMFEEFEQYGYPQDYDEHLNEDSED